MSLAAGLAMPDETLPCFGGPMDGARVPAAWVPKGGVMTHKVAPAVYPFDGRKWPYMDWDPAGRPVTYRRQGDRLAYVS